MMKTGILTALAFAVALTTAASANAAKMPNPPQPCKPVACKPWPVPIPPKPGGPIYVQ